MGHHTGSPGAPRSLRRVCPRGSRGSKVRRRDSSMEGEQGTPAPSSSNSTSVTTTTNNNNNNNNSSSHHNHNNHNHANNTSSSSTSTSSNANANANGTTSATGASSTSGTSTTTTTAATASSSANGGANGGANSNSTSTSTSSSSNSGGRQTLPQISVYSGIPDRQTVQVIQQALHRQPSTAAQYLQQMYAAQQQHLMLQTAALQQQHLSTAQLQSLAAATHTHASIAAGRQGTSSPQTGSSQATINLTTSPAAAQLISRAQSVSSPAAGISQQAVLLGNPSSPTTLTASQAQMYLRAQMAQQSNLVQVARSLGRAVPLSPQLIFTPTATVTALQTDAAAQSASAQVQNLAIRSQQGAPSSSSSSSSSSTSSTFTTTSSSSSSSSSSTLTQTQALQALSLKQTPISIQPAALIKTPTPGIKPAPALAPAPASSEANHQSEGVKKSEGAMVTEARAVNMSRNVGSVGAHPLIAPAYAHIQPHSLVKQQPQQFVIQQQSTPALQRTATASTATVTTGAGTTTMATQLHLQTASIQPHTLHAAQPLTLTTTHASSTAAPPGPGPGPVPVLPKLAPSSSSSSQTPNQHHHHPPLHTSHHQHHPHHHHHHPPAPTQQATIFHSTTVSPHALGHHHHHQHHHHHHHQGHTAHIHAHATHAALSQAKSLQPVQLTAINLQIHPTPNQASRLAPECKDKPTSLVVRESCPPHSSQQPASASPQGAKPAELSQPKTPTPTPTPTPATATTTTTPTATATATTQQPQTQAGSPVRVNNNTSPETPPPAMTSGNDCEAPSVVVGSTAQQNGENKPPQAIVKPQVLTHIIEGFVIQEGAEPFPMERPPIQNDSPKKPDQQLPSDSERSPAHNLANNTDSEPEDANQQDMKDPDEEPKLTCEFCGWVDFAYKFKGTKRFCSMVCAKRYNVGCTKRIGLFHPDRTKTSSRWRRRPHRGRPSSDAKKQKLSSPQQQQQQLTGSGSISSPMPSQPSQGESSPCSDMSSFEEPPSPLSVASSGPPVPSQNDHVRSPMVMDQEEDEEDVRGVGGGGGGGGGGGRELAMLPQHFLPCDPTKWNVEEVYEFIRSLPGCQEIADEFRSQEIDGQAMLLLKEDHLMSAMNIKLGPALKIYARISMLKDS
ncbi:polyhomeotic-like protein 2b [Engraulis encrasicolus]|uniref:polyhomeotic-like protein 2b n=1 Tax=Engraulis encrasicolus TaxID=184585 RepID=UPI002FD76A85